MENSVNILPTYIVRLYMAGDIESAKKFIRNICYSQGLCVTIEPTSFIYTGGEEAGFVIGFVNYPRFPSSSEEIFNKAKEIAKELIPHLNQKSALLVATDKTEWLSIKPWGER